MLKTRPLLLTALTAVFFLTQTVFPHAAETGFWAQRADAARRYRSAESGARLALQGLPLGSPRAGHFQADSTVTTGAEGLARHGAVREQRAGDGGTVFHVQDVHGHAEAQKNIAAIVGALLTRYPGATVLLEGTAGPIDLNALRPAGNPHNAAAAGFFFRAGVVTGAEAAVLGAEGNPRVGGAEDAEQYIANRRSVDHARAARPLWQKRLAQWRSAANAAKATVYSPSLRDLDRRAAAWAGDGGILDRAATLAAAFELPPPSVDGALARFVRLIEMEKNLSREAAERERTAFLETLSDRLTAAEIQEVAAAALSLRSGDLSPSAFYADLKDLAARHGVPLKNFPFFDAFVEYAALTESVRPEALESELNEREGRLWAALARSPAERELRSLDETLGDWARLTDLSMTPAEWRAYLARGVAPGDVARRLAVVGAPAPAVDGLDAFEAFYRFAESRNQALADAAWRAAQRGAPVVLVAGGFHNAGVGALLTEKGVDFITVSPKLGEAVAGARGPFDLFFRDHTPLERLFQAPRVSLAETSTLAPLTPDGGPRARALRELGPAVRTALAVPGEPHTAPAADGGRDIVVVRDTDGESIPPAGARAIVTDVPAAIDEKFDTPRVSVYHRTGSLGFRLGSGLKSFARAWASARARWLGPMLLAAFLLPLAAVSPAHAYTLIEGPAGVHVVVEKGEHLWGAATHVLKAEGHQKPTNAQINEKVKEMATLNGLQNPDLVHPDTPYAAHPAPAPTATDISAAFPVSLDPAVGVHGGISSQTVPFEAEPAASPMDPAVVPVDDAASIARGPAVPPGVLAALAATLLLVTAWGHRAYSQRRVVGAVGRSWDRLTSTARAGAAAAGAALNQGPKNVLDPKTATLLLGVVIATAFTVVPGIETWGAAAVGWIDPGAFIEHFRSFVVGQWPVLAALFTGLLGAVYYVWFRVKEVDLSAIEKNEVRVRDWITLLDRMEQDDAMGEEDLSWLANNVHALILNNRVTEAAVADRGQLEKRIDAYRAIARLSARTVRFLDRRLETAGLAAGNTRDRLVDTREKFFLYQLYGLKTAHALVPASVAHWAFSNFDRRDSWFEKKKLGAVLRFVRGVRPMIRQTVGEYRQRLFEDDTRPGRTLWERAEGLSVVSLGNILVPGLYDEDDRAGLARVFDGLRKKSETKELSDMSAKDLHRKGWGTMISLLIWSVAISRMVSVFPAVMAFFTGLGVTMALFRIQTLGTRRDGFFRDALKTWREMNQRPHANGRLKGNGESAGEDPFHLNRDFARYHFQEAENALREELTASDPSTDLVLLIAQNENEKAYFESRANDRSLFPASVPVVVLIVPSHRGSFAAYARAWTYLFSPEFKALAEGHPRLKGRAPWTLNVGTLVSKAGGVEGMDKPLADLPLFANRLGAGPLGQRTIFDLAVMNAYRATRARTDAGDRGGLALRWADRAYVGPVRVPAGTGVTLDTQWVNREDMARFNFGAVIASLDKPIKLIRRSRVEKTLGLLAEEHTNRVYDTENDRLKQVQAFSGEGFYAFDAPAAAAHHEFLRDVMARTESLPVEARLDPPSLNLMTYYLVPLCIAQAEDAEVSHKINVYFSGHGFLSDPLPEAIQHFNNRSANALAATFHGNARPRFSLNAAFVDESLYASADAAVEQDEADFEPGPAAPNAPRWRDRLRRAVINGTVHTFLLLGLLFPAMAAAGSKPLPAEAVWGGPLPYVAAMAGVSLPPQGSWLHGAAALRAWAAPDGLWRWVGVSGGILILIGFSTAVGSSLGIPDAGGMGWALGAAALLIRGHVKHISQANNATTSSAPATGSSGTIPTTGAAVRRAPRGDSASARRTSAPAAGALLHRAGRFALDRLTGGRALLGVKLALLPAALFVNYGGLVQAFGSAGALVFTPALLLIPAFFLTVFELFVDDLIALRLKGSPAAAVPAPRTRGTRATDAVDVTAEAWAHPQETVEALSELLNALRASPHRNAATERELARLWLRAAAEFPLEDDLARRFDVAWLRTTLAKAESTRARRLARRATDPRGEGRARIDDVVELSLAHQIAWAWKAHRSGSVPRAEFRQAGYLRGLSGRSLAEESRADALLGPLGSFLGVEGMGGAKDWANGARKLAGLLADAVGHPVEDHDAELTMIRVTEFLPGAGDGTAHRPVLEKHLIERAKRFVPGADPGDVLIINGRGADEARLKSILRRRVSGFPAFDAYLAACRVVVLPEERFTPEAVIGALPTTATRGRTMNFFTADPTAILFNPHRSHLSYRVLLLEWVAGELRAVDLMDLARQALKAARVVATSA